MSKFQVKAQDSRDEIFSQLALALRCSPSFIHSDPKWFHDLQPAENRASSQREKTYCGSETCSRSVLFHSHAAKLCLYTINTVHLCQESVYQACFMSCHSNKEPSVFHIGDPNIILIINWKKKQFVYTFYLQLQLGQHPWYILSWFSPVFIAVSLGSSTQHTLNWHNVECGFWIEICCIKMIGPYFLHLFKFEKKIPRCIICSQTEVRNRFTLHYFFVLIKLLILLHPSIAFTYFNCIVCS